MTKPTVSSLGSTQRIDRKIQDWQFSSQILFPLSEVPPWTAGTDPAFRQSLRKAIVC